MEASVFVITTLINVAAISGRSNRVVSPTCLNLSLALGVHGESAALGLPENSVELVDFPVDRLDLVGHGLVLGQVEQLD